MSKQASKSPWSQECKKKIISPHNLQAKVNSLKEEGHRIITLNGSFDLLHAGHLYIIHQAKSVGGTLILALNSDSSVRSYKGPNKPLIPLTERIELMSALEFVDYVTWFDEPDPRNLLSIVCPHVHVNGAEYGSECIESDIVRECGGELYIVDRIPQLSTSDIIQKILKAFS
jgi:rfaE bifunctional protein nucleotidyltransferase chain/domain